MTTRQMCKSSSSACNKLVVQRGEVRFELQRTGAASKLKVQMKV